nr:putative retrotransposon protein [Tanacetum cinerariifolium]
MSTENGVNPPAPNPAHNSNFSLLSVLGRERLTEESFGYLFYKPKDNVVFMAQKRVFLEREMISKEDSGKDKISDSTLSKLDDPANYKEMMASPVAAKWKEAMKIDIQSMYDNQVWNLIDTITGLKTMGCKWIFKKKTDMDGKVHTYKARGVTISAFHDYEIWQMDVKTAFLNGKLTEDVFMAQPEGFENAKMNRVPYALAVGSIMYAMTHTRPDVSFALSMVSRHQQNSSEGHWTAVKNIFKYLRNTKDRLLVYGGEEELRVTGYCDASWKIDQDDSRSQSGWIFLLNGGAVTWKSSKKDTVVDSTCESEYIAACEASKEAIWMKNFIGDLGVVPTVQDPIEKFCDNESAVVLTKEPKDHEKSKHIERKFHFVRSKVEEGRVIVKHIQLEDNPVDPFTKALDKVNSCNETLGVRISFLFAALLIANEPRVQRGTRHYHRRHHYVRECIEPGEINLLKVHTDDNLADPFTKALSKGKITQHARSTGLRLASSFINSVLNATKLFEFVISEKLGLSRALKLYLMRGSSGNASTLNNSGARVRNCSSATEDVAAVDLAAAGSPLQIE